MKLYTVLETSALIHKLPSTIYKDLGRRPYSLPPVHRLPNCRGVFFKDVPAWVAGELPSVSAPALKISKRGRPSHKSKLNTQ